eukprot:CAMPEP_0171169262 /NCGR_PEP_ID=MMETSP0790-20130122/8124_1 /TAXON_ID=2925 /ORGANISM="Alexandrium catenella, Strain OF101" /LENGTH=122 /DNA_ID=CAMNT_0011634105 /DNA_START=65 /DNA_END=433 /DNA_ORIENTATION=-
MASVGKIASVTRPLRAAVKPQKYVAEHRLRATPLANDAARAGLVPVTSTPAPAVVTSGHNHGYDWGVTWPGHSLLQQPNVNIPEMSKAFQRWHRFSFGGDLLSELMACAGSVVSSSMPGKKH